MSETPPPVERRAKKRRQADIAADDRFASLFKKALGSFAVIGITCTISLVGFGIVLSQLQQTRREFVRDSCNAQNDRHDNATNYIIDIANEQTRSAKSDEQRQAIQKSLSEWLTLIDLQAPKQNCAYQAKVATGDAEPLMPTPTPKPTPTFNKESP